MTDKATHQVKDGTGRQMSTIGFPYFGLDEAETIARTIHDTYGTTCTTDQLAAALGHGTTNSGSFRGKVSAGRMFGLIETRRGNVDLTDLGGRIIDAHTQSEARVDAFLNVVLYKQVFDDFRGGALPGDAGLESHMTRLGVTPNQVDKARQAFQRSAQHADFFHQGRDRLVIPPRIQGRPQEDKPRDQSGEDTNGVIHEQVDQPSRGHPLIDGLFQQLPSMGAAFPTDQQDQWLILAKHILRTVWPTKEHDLQYDRDDDDQAGQQ